MIRPLLVFLAFAAQALPAEPVLHVANEARLFLRVPDGDPPLQDLRVSGGSVGAGTWEADPERRARLSDLSFPIHWWRWKEFTVEFTPAKSGSIDLVLNGAWAEASPGVLQRMEVCWDALTAEGTSIPNGSFETMVAAAPAGWQCFGGVYPSPEEWPRSDSKPLEGDECAVTWQNRQLLTKLKVQAGVPVRLTLNARASTPPGFKAPATLPADSPAHEACAKLKRGINLGNSWEAPPATWGGPHGPDDIEQIAAQGFDHVRVPVAWHHSMKDGVIDPALLAQVEPVLRRALELRLTVILDWHHFDALVADPAGQRATFVAGWKTLATHFQDWPEELYLELLNEPHTALDGEALNETYAAAISAIREIMPERILLVDPSHWAAISALDRLVLPDEDDRLIVSVHCYDPFRFTHQGAPWVQLGDMPRLNYPGPPAEPVVLPESMRGDVGHVAWIEAYNTLPTAGNPCAPHVFETLLDDAVAWSKHFGRPIHLGEFGAYRAAGPDNRQRYVADIRRAAEARNIPWAMWDWKAGFAYWSAEEGKPLLKDALFGSP